MKKVLTFFTALLISAALPATDLSGTYSSDLTLDLAGSPYIITGDVTINNAATLTVNSGVEVKFNNGRSLFIKEGAHIVATNALFTSNQASPAAGDWNYFTLNDGSTGTLTGCTVEYGREIDLNNGTLTLNGTDVLNFYNYGFQIGYYGIATLNMTGGNITGSGRNYAVALYETATTTLNGVFMTGFSSGAYVAANATLTLITTTISNNTYEGIVCEGNSNLEFQGSVVTGNTYPLKLNGPANLTVSGNVDLSGNDVDAITINFMFLSQYWFLPSFNEYIGNLMFYVPYYFKNGNFYVNAGGGELEIASDNILKFKWSKALWIDGTLIADGDEGEGEYVYFTSVRDDNWGGDTNDDGTATVPASGDWKGIIFNDDSNDDDCLLDRVKVRFAGSGSIGAVTTYNASPTLNSNDVSNSYYGFCFYDDSNPVFSNNIVGSSEMVPIAMSVDADPLFFDTNVFSFSDNEYDAVGILGGTLVTDAVLPVRDVIDVPNITYVLLGTVTVPETLSMTIAPSVVIKSYHSNHRVIVKGLLTADGDTGTEIVFTSVKDDTHGNPMDTNKDGTQTVPSTGDWSGIVFESTTDPASLLDHCIIKYASLKNTYYNTRYISGGAITLENADAVISNCEIKDVDFGIYAFQSSNPQILNNQFVNSTKTPVALSVASDPTFIGNTFINASWTALGIIGENVGLDGVIKNRNVAGYDNITYLLLEDMIVNSGTYVVVDPGVVIKFLNTGIYVRGGFMADGTTIGKDYFDEIVFTSLMDDNYGNPMDTNGDGNITAPETADWETIRFEDTSDDAFNLLRFVRIKYNGDWMWGGVTFTDAGGLVQNSVISDAENYGVKCEGAATPTFDNVQITNTSYYPIGMSLKSDPTFTNITFAGNGYNGIKILEGELASDAFLKKRDVAGINNIAYIVENLTIQQDATLTIQKGVVIKLFNNYYNTIVIEGALIADATPDEKIVITSLKDDSYGGDTNNDGNSTSPSAGDYGSLVFLSSAIDTANLLNNCLIRYGGSDYPGSNYKCGEVRIYDASIVADSVVFEHSPTSAIGIFGSADPTISNCEMTNIERTPITMSMFSNPLFDNNFALNNGLYALGIVPEIYSLNGTIESRDFGGFENITYYFYGTCTINSGTTIVVERDLVFKSNNITYFDVKGGLRIEGEAGFYVVFTDYRDDTFGNPMDTNGDGLITAPSIGYHPAIVFEDVSEDANCLVNFTEFYYNKIGITLQQASPVIQHAHFENMNWGVSLGGVSEPVLENCVFNDLVYGPMIISLVSYPASTANNLIAGTTYKVIGVLGETLVQEVTLSKRNFGGVENIPYFFTGDYTIGTSAALTIEPGVMCKFGLNKRLYVQRSLIAEGGPAPDETIVFTSIADDFYGGDSNSDGNNSVPTKSSWRGIKFEGESLDPLCSLDYVVIKYAGASYNQNYGAIVTENASPTIQNSTLMDNEFGLVAFGASNPKINYCDIYHNTYYGVKNVNQAFVIDAENNWWGSNTGPTHSANPGGTGDEVSDAVDYDPWLTDNASNPIMGDVSLNGYIQAYDASLILQWLVDPVGNPLNAKQQQVADVSGNGTIMAFDASLILQYVVGIINHFPAELTDPGNAGQVSDVELVVGNAEVTVGEEFEIPVDLRNVEGLSATGIALRYEPALLEVLEIENLTSQMNLNYHVDESAGEIRIATASVETFDEDFTLLKIRFKAQYFTGTAETQLVVGNFTANETDLTQSAVSGNVIIHGITTGITAVGNAGDQITIYPNPFNETLNIKLQQANEGLVDVEVYDLFGRKIATIFNGPMHCGENLIVWDGTARGAKLENGLYLVSVKRSGKVETVKVQLIND